MNPIENDFFEEFRYLEAICQQIYGRSPDKKLGVTQYLEDMKANESRGRLKVPDWNFQYRRLRECRNKRNNLAHPNSTYDVEPCSEDDIEFIMSFKESILNQTDPLSILRSIADCQTGANPYAPFDSNDFGNSDTQQSQNWVLLFLFACIVIMLALTVGLFIWMITSNYPMG